MKGIDYKTVVKAPFVLLHDGSAFPKHRIDRLRYDDGVCFIEYNDNGYVYTTRTLSGKYAIAFWEEMTGADFSKDE